MNHFYLFILGNIGSYRGSLEYQKKKLRFLIQQIMANGLRHTSGPISQSYRYINWRKCTATLKTFGWKWIWIFEYLNRHFNLFLGWVINLEHVKKGGTLKNAFLKKTFISTFQSRPNFHTFAGQTLTPYFWVNCQIKICASLSL